MPGAGADCCAPARVLGSKPRGTAPEPEDVVVADPDVAGRSFLRPRAGTLDGPLGLAAFVFMLFYPPRWI